MNFAKIWQVVKTVLGKLTDVLLVGRNAGLWDKGQGPDLGGGDPMGAPHDPDKFIK